MVFWFPSAKWSRNLVQSLHSIFWVDTCLLCPRIWAAICVAVLVQGWSWLQPAPRRALWLWLFQGDKGWCGVSSLSATVCALRPPLPPTACVMVWLQSLQHRSGTCLKPASALGFFTSAWCCVCGVAWVSIGLDAPKANPFQSRMYGWKIYTREILSSFTVRKELQSRQSNVK